MPMMKAIVMERPGPPEVLRYVDVPRPEPAPGQVLVRAHAIGVGMPEVLVRRGQYGWMPPLPAIPGIEMSGVVEKVGRGRDDACGRAGGFRLGARVEGPRRLLCRVHRGGGGGALSAARGDRPGCGRGALQLPGRLASAQQRAQRHAVRIVHGDGGGRRGGFRPGPTRASSPGSA